MSIAVLIVAAGRGARAATAGDLPKQYMRIGGRAILRRAVEAFAGHPRIADIQVVIHPDDRAHYDAALGELAARARPPVPGGDTRQGSVRLGLEALRAASPALVLIHDAARPLVTADVIDRVIDALGQRSGAIAALPLADTLKRAGPDHLVAGTVERTGLWRAQTPQGFAFEAILRAHAAAAAAGRHDFTDDAAVAEWAGIETALVAGAERNIKVTTAEDIALAERNLLAPSAAAPDVRTGNGFDVHRLIPGDAVTLCGVSVPHEARLEGHSDADVALHALVDAILGALGEGDIGQHFPPGDARWKDAPSRLFVAHAAALLAARGGRLLNADITILAEAPRIAPHREAMRAAVAGMLGIEAGRVSVKATTTERLGFTGRREGIAAIATATVLLP